MMVEGAPVTNAILSGISLLDDMGAWDWNLRLGGFIWFLIFAAIRNTIGKTNGVEWYALIHSLITGIGGVICAYLTFGMAEDMTGTPGESQIGTASLSSHIWMNTRKLNPFLLIVSVLLCRASRHGDMWRRFDKFSSSAANCYIGLRSY